MNLLTTPFIPIITASGQQQTIAVADLLRREDAPVALAAERGDFNAALAQFLITLFQFVMAPADDEEWRELLDAPPTPEEVTTLLSPLLTAFQMEGAMPFMQDAALEPGALEARTLDALLLESPGGNTVKNNMDFFIKRQEPASWDAGTAAIALLTLQLNAPSGGQGHRTSLRGGGPLTTLIWPNVLRSADGTQYQANLWQKLWCNVLACEDSGTDTQIALPWTAPCITSEGGRTVLEGWPRAPTALERLALCGFATPRRILLLWEGEGATRRCTGYVMQNFGANYPSDAFLHPASPYYRDKDGAWLPQHIQADGFDYTHFTEVCGPPKGSDAQSRQRAQIVQQALQSQPRREALADTSGIWACAYAMDNMKVLAWHEAHYPLFPDLPDAHRQDFWREAQKMIAASNQAAKLLGQSVNKLHGDGALAKRSFYINTEAPFYAVLNTIATDIGVETRLAQRQGWVKQLLRTVLQQFDLHGERHVDHQSRLSHVEAAAKERQRLFNSVNKVVHQALDLKPEKASKAKASKPLKEAA